MREEVIQLIEQVAPLPLQEEYDSLAAYGWATQIVK